MVALCAHAGLLAPRAGGRKPLCRIGHRRGPPPGETRRIEAELPYCPCPATFLPLFGGRSQDRDPAFPRHLRKWGRAATLAEEGILFMRRIVLAAAIATSALGLAACGETAETADETVADMNADAESVADEATAAGEEAMAEMEEGMAEMEEGAADVAATAEEAVDNAAAETGAAASGMLDKAVDKAIEKGEAAADEALSDM
ncbi:MAG: hypothetical protein ACOCYR_05530 [Erythrobacter sp.]